MRFRSMFVWSSLVWLLLCWHSASRDSLADQDTVFGALTGEIEKQIQLDKQDFVIAQTCAEWFYRKKSPRSSKPKLEGVSFDSTPDCTSRYPNGLSDAREDFSRAQSLLTMSLTFYEYALVADRNDDQLYSARELQDMLESFDLSYSEAASPESTLVTLQSTFRRMHGTGNIDTLMTGMSRLYDKGYRLTAGDRVAMNHVIG